ncbi:MAG: DUF5694 domain-containing protein [Verrucomicrobiota bacterium]|nr:DUF5694 domain-containing protein [Verrucomicrobiota bacterium]
MNRRSFLVLLCVYGPFLGSVNAEPPAEAVRVLVLGTYHFDNPGQDLHNMKVDDIRTPTKQAELADAAARLARFSPNKIAVEALSDRADLTTKKFDGFTPETLTKDSDERVQIAFRLAHNLGQKSVYGIDEQSDKIDYFPFDKVEEYAKAHGETPLLEKLHGRVGEMMKKMEADQKTKSVPAMLVQINELKEIETGHCDFYYGLLRLGDRVAQPGADLNGAWYLRNAKIFAKLMQIAKPGDRILVVFGSGHSYWLRHFVRSTPGFVLVEANEYLR